MNETIWLFCDWIGPKDITINCGVTDMVADRSSLPMEPLRPDWLLLAKKNNKLRIAAALLPHRSNNWGYFILLNQNIRYQFHHTSLWGSRFNALWFFNYVFIYMSWISMLEIWTEAQAIPPAIDWEFARGGAPDISTICKAECICCWALPHKYPKEN